MKEYSGSRTGRLCAFRQGTTTRPSTAGTAAEGRGPRRRDAGSTARALRPKAVVALCPPPFGA